MKKMRFANAILMLACVGFALTAQTAFAATITPASNERDYKLGLKYGHAEYHNCYITKSECEFGPYGSENYFSSDCNVAADKNTVGKTGPNVDNVLFIVWQNYLIY